MSLRRIALHTAPRKVEMMMTPMIDIVFQLLIFFLLTFKIVVPEGDFQVKLPQAAPPQQRPIEEPPTTIHVKLTAGDASELARVQVGNVELQPPFESALRRKIMTLTSLVGPGTAGPGIAAEPEVELDCDYHLHYEHTMMAITAVSGYVTPEKNIVKLIETIKFAPPEKSTHLRGG